jgi:CHAD domain-containing protein
MIVSTPWLDALRAQIVAVQQGGSEEDVHQLRVSTRRLSSWLKLGRIKILRSDLRWVRAAGGAVRDLDVVLAQRPPAPLADWLMAERSRCFQQLLQVVGAPRTAALLSALTHVAPVEEARARETIGRLARAVLDLGEKLQVAPNDVEGFHRLRRSVRALRYALEWLQEKTGAFKQFQDITGTAADLSVALLLLDVYPDAADLSEYRSQLEQDFAARRIDAVTSWPALREVVAAVA